MSKSSVLLNHVKNIPDKKRRNVDLSFLNFISRLDFSSYLWYHHLNIVKYKTILVKNDSNFNCLADDEAPILNCPNISSTTDERLNSSSTVLLNSTATDNVDFHLDVICSHSSEDIFLNGDTSVNCSSTDAAGNTDTCLLVVTITGVDMIICYAEKFRHRSGSGFWDSEFLFKAESFLKCWYVLLIVILRRFLLDLTFWIMWRKFLI